MMSSRRPSSANQTELKDCISSQWARTMAELGPGPYRTGDIADTLGVKINTLGPVRASLIKKGMVYSPSHGEMAFTVPLFDDFMRRAIPQLDP